ncbi:Rieske (2Fe-2S) protein [Halocalculus aciditolerans]|nr:Rieske (2Fe-2S) protein [Halocalculus aciditolerans]
MSDTVVATVEEVEERRSVLFTAYDARGNREEVIVVPCEETGAKAWVNRCTHEAQRLDRGMGAAMRDGEIICPKHGSMFDACSGDCDNGEAAGTTLVSVDVTVDGDEVTLTDSNYTFAHEGEKESNDDVGPGSSSHLSF